jgi:hypothetical protein
MAKTTKPTPTKAPAQVTATPAADKPLRVRATKMGYFNEERKREGDVFVLPSSRYFSKKWMEIVPDRTPLRATTGKEELEKQHRDILRQKAAGEFPGVDNPPDGPDPIGADE